LLAFFWKVFLSQNVLDQTHSQRVDVSLSEVQSLKQIGVFLDLGSKIRPTVPVVSFLLQVQLQHSFVTIGIDQLEFSLTFHNISWLNVEMRLVLLFSKPLQSRTAISKKVPYFNLSQSIASKSSVFKRFDSNFKS
jgi:hypothetical protein